MAIGDKEILPIIDWYELFAGVDSDDAVIGGLAFRGRWTAIASAAKEGKSTFLLGIAVAAARAGTTVLCVDSENGRTTMHQRVEDWMQLKPADLDNLKYNIVPPKLDTEWGAAIFRNTVEHFDAQLVIIDGLNGAVDGGENDDTTWRDFYELAIAPCKARNIAVITADNLGKDQGRGPRGSSVKLDKADAVLEMRRTDLGCKLTATHRRTDAYPPEQHYAIVGASEDDPPLAVTLVEASDPEGTGDLVVTLNRLGLPLDVTQRKARAALKVANITARNTALSAALRVRRTMIPTFDTANGETPAQPPLESLGITTNQGNGDDSILDSSPPKTPARWPSNPRVSSVSDTRVDGITAEASETLDADEVWRRLKEQF